MSPSVLLVQPHEVMPFDMVEHEGRVVAAVTYHSGDPWTATLGSFHFERAEAFGRCLHLSVWSDIQEITLSGPIRVVRGVEPPPPVGCTCSSPR